jgi:hypothetical protein
MAKNVYYGNDMTLSIQTEGGTSIPVGVLKDVEVIAATEHDELYGADSTKRQTVKQREFGVDWSAGFASMDMALIQEWLGGSGSSSTSFVDTSDPQLFKIIGEVTPDGGSTNKKAVVDNANIPDMPVISVTEGEFETTELEGRASDITATGPT